jgi:uncharacterized membrane protein YbaN (DUF454 family)
MRWLWLAAGGIALALGVIGVFLPVLPTTPFVILAAACFARASPALERRLLDSELLGPTLRDWREHRSLKRRTKVVAIVMMSLSIAATIAFVVEATWQRVALAAVGIATAAWLWRIPSRRAE